MPRLDGELVCGATVEERGEDTSVTAGAVYTLLRDAQLILPALAEAELVETAAGLRPGTPDNAPYLGRGALEGLVVASGHYRNGILLAPTSASVVAGALGRQARTCLGRALLTRSEAGAVIIAVNGEQVALGPGATVKTVVEQLAVRGGRHRGGAQWRGRPAQRLGVDRAGR